MKVFKNITLNSKLNSILRNIPYPIIRKIRKFPPSPENSNGMPLIIIAQTKEFYNALWSAYSWIVSYPQKLHVKLYIDGKITGSMQNSFYKLFPQGQIASAFDTTEKFIDQLDSSHGYRAFVKYQRFSRKLSICVYESQFHDILYSDADVLSFATGTEIEKWIDGTGAANCHLVDPLWPSQDEWLNKKMEQLGVRSAKGLNSGVLMLKQNFINSEKFFTLFEEWTLENLTWHTDQTFFSNILLHQGSSPLDESSYINQAPEFFMGNRWIPITEKVKMRHYISSIRHLFYLQGLTKVNEVLLYKQKNTV